MQLVYGINPVLEVVRQSAGRIKKIIVADGRTGSALHNVISAASEQNIPVSFKDRASLENMAGCNSHQGVVALCEEFAYAHIDDVIENGSGGAVLILDGINDPQNLGAIIRTAHCFGARGVVIPENRAVCVTPAVIKASSGSAYLTPVVRETNLSRAIDHLKESGFWIYGADAESGSDICEFSDAGPVGLVMGSEGRGLRPLIRKKCDFLLSIPMAGKIGSLNVSVAAGIILYEILMKQERRK